MSGKMLGFSAFDLGCNKNADGSVDIVMVGEPDRDGIDGYMSILNVDKERAIQLAELILEIADKEADE